MVGKIFFLVLIKLKIEVFLFMIRDKIIEIV